MKENYEEDQNQSTGVSYLIFLVFASSMFILYKAGVIDALLMKFVPYDSDDSETDDSDETYNSDDPFYMFRGTPTISSSRSMIYQ